MYVLIGNKKEDTEEHGEGQVKTEKVWSDEMTTSQGTPRVSRSSQKLGERYGIHSPSKPPKETSSVTL